jgi:hypothetical protein
MCCYSKKRWVVERSIAWAGRNRLASKEYNRNPESSRAFLYPGSIAMLLNRLYPRCSFLLTILGAFYGTYTGSSRTKNSPAQFLITV